MPRGKPVARVGYLQQPICQPQGDGGEMIVPPTVGDGMRADVDALNVGLLRTLYDAAGLGPWAMMQLFVGNATMAPRARTTLHYDHVDNFYLQVAGRKTFRLFPPAESGALAPYAFHNEFDRRSAVNLEAPDLTGAFPRAAAACRADVTLEPGDLLFLPRWWWHEVVTDYDAAAPLDDLTVSLSFWFDIGHRMLEPPFPLGPDLRSEVSRQLEIAIADWLGDSRPVKPFLRAMRRQIRDLERGDDDRGCALAAGSAGDGPSWPRLREGRPDGVAADTWDGAFEFVLFKLILLLGDHGVARWVHESRDYAETE